MALVRPVLHRLSCSNEMVRNTAKHEFWGHRVDQVRSLRQISTQLRLANLGVNSASSAYFASTFGAVTKQSDDEDIATNDTSTPTPVSTSTTPLGPITRARARRLTHQVSSLLCSGSSYLENGETCTLVFTQKQWIGSKGKRHRAGWIRIAGQTRLVTAATTSSRLRFCRSSTFWKAYQIYFPTDLESPPYLFGVNRNPRFTT
jgi:hypothetical protein